MSDIITKPEQTTDPGVLVQHLRNWLGLAGVQMFRTIRRAFGTVSPVIPPSHPLNPNKSQGLILPHNVHANEGMQVRNFLRSFVGEAWTTEQYDNRWAELVELAIRSPEEEMIEALIGALSVLYEAHHRSIKLARGPLANSWDDPAQAAAGKLLETLGAQLKEGKGKVTWPGPNTVNDDKNEEHPKDADIISIFEEQP